MFCGKTENKSINKIHKRTIRLIYDAEDATFEDLFERDKLQTIILNGNIMWNFFDVKRNRYNLSTNYLTRQLAGMVHKHYVSKEVFCGIRFKKNIKT